VGRLPARHGVFVLARRRRQGDLRLPLIKELGEGKEAGFGPPLFFVLFIAGAPLPARAHTGEECQMLRASITAIIGLIFYTSIAWAACPPGTRYTCYQGYNGKVICGCR
jgi:hypothetical protein